MAHLNVNGGGQSSPGLPPLNIKLGCLGNSLQFEPIHANDLFYLDGERGRVQRQNVRFDAQFSNAPVDHLAVLGPGVEDGHEVAAVASVRLARACRRCGWAHCTL